MTPLAQRQFKEAFSVGNLQDAERLALLSLEQNPNDWNAIYLLGTVCRANGDFRGALSQYHQALRLTSQSASILRACGIAHQHLGEFDKAILAFSEALRDEPKSIECLNSLGITYRKMKKYHHAIYYYCIAVNLCLESAHVSLRQKGLVRVVADTHDAKGCMINESLFEAYFKAVLDTPYITLIENIGSAFEAMGDSKNARYFFRIADTKSPVDEDLLSQIYKNAEQDAELTPASADALEGVSQLRG